MGWQTFVLVLGLISAVVPGVWALELSRSEKLSDDPVQLVERLGDGSFAARRAATARLIQLGVDAVAALERGAGSEDREIRFRSRHVLQLVRQRDFQHRLQAFATGMDAPAKCDLPSWARFSEDVGSGPEARALFVEMQRAEPELLAAFEQAPDAIGDILSQRVDELQKRRESGGRRGQPSLGTIASLLFILDSQDVKLPMMMTQSVGAYFRYPSFATAIQRGSQREILRRMLGRWIEKSEGWDAHHAMCLAMQYEMPVGIVPARRILKGEIEQPNSTHFLGYALFTVAKFGDEADYALVESLLENETPYGGTVPIAGKKKLRTQIRDIALATLVQLAGLDHKEFGFTRYRIHPHYVFNASSLAFENDAEREAAIKKWFEYRRQE